MPDLKLPDDVKLAGRVLENHYKTEQDKINRGAIGRLIGGRDNVPANVAAAIGLIAAAALIICVIAWSGEDGFTKKDGIAALSSLVTLTVGYLFGRFTKSN